MKLLKEIAESLIGAAVLTIVILIGAYVTYTIVSFLVDLGS